eukprot:TRINITY_DN2942_c0_g1_i1.p2 TRINITY_DN2942_c0_g1~~TRINITY_DN2942_c0_g1_i1.p2  ORF type:complete len:114 (+),score=17.10 TRINITY_DN2942_c0_g1_i1:548-889(+)
MIWSWLRHGSTFVLVYAINSRSSFATIDTYYRFIKKYKTEFKIVLVANKSDVQDRTVSTEEGKDLAKTLQCPFYEVSAKNHEESDRILRVAIAISIGPSLIHEDEKKKRCSIS